MPAKAVRHVIDTRAVAPIEGGAAPLEVASEAPLSSTAKASSSSSTTARRVVAVSGVVSIDMPAGPHVPASLSTTGDQRHRAMESPQSAAAPPPPQQPLQHFALPDAVRQRLAAVQAGARLLPSTTTTIPVDTPIAPLSTTQRDGEAVPATSGLKRPRADAAKDTETSKPSSFKRAALDAKQREPASPRPTSDDDGGVTHPSLRETRAVTVTSSTTPSAGRTTTTTTTKSKPLIQSRRWNLRMKGAVTGVAGSGKRREGNRVSATPKTTEEREDSENEGTEDVAGFGEGGAEVIRFHDRSRRSTTTYPPGDEDGDGDGLGKGSRWRALNPDLSSSSVSSASWSDADSKESERAEDDSTPLSRSRRVRQRREARHRATVDRHFAGYDDDDDAALAAAAEAVLRSDSESTVEDDESADDDDGDGGKDGVWSDSDEELDDDDDDNDSAESEEADEESSSLSSYGSEDSHSSSSSMVSSSRSGSGGVEHATKQSESAGSGSGGGFRPGRHAAAKVTATNTPATSTEDDAAAPGGVLPQLRRFGAIRYAFHIARGDRYGCHHTILTLHAPVTVQGPCGVVGLGCGEIVVGGFYLGQKQLTLWSREHRAVLMPMRRLKSKNAGRAEVPAWGDLPPVRCATAGEGGGADTVLYPSDVLRLRSRRRETEGRSSEQPKAAEEREEEDDEEDDDDPATLHRHLQDVEAIFGTIDWDWVEGMVNQWRTVHRVDLAAADPLVLVVQPYAHGSAGSYGKPTRRYYLRKALPYRKRLQEASASKAGKKGALRAADDDDATWMERAAGGELHDRAGADLPTDAYVEIASFLARYSERSVDLAMLPTVVPSVAQTGSGCVMVVGSQNIGKSTLCRFLANAMFSQHGLCYWLDLDLGQPEFGVPGQLALHRVRYPLLRPNDTPSVELVHALFLGGFTVTCPLSTANALAAMCAVVEEIAKEHPVIVNTHGWVLHTGRRTTSEVVRRLRPRQLIHLVKPQEEAWSKDTEALMDPVNGLNGEVVARRFLVRHVVSSSSSSASASPPVAVEADKTGAKTGEEQKQHKLNSHTTDSTRRGGKRKRQQPTSPPPSTIASAAKTTASPSASFRVLGRLPHPTEYAATEETGRGQPPVWTGSVTAVRVQRSDGLLKMKELAKQKGANGRRALWQRYLAPLLQFYESRSTPSRGESAPPTRSLADDATTLLRAPLSTLDEIVLTDLDEKNPSVSLRELAALLEHSVVAVQFHRREKTAANTTRGSTATAPKSDAGCRGKQDDNNDDGGGGASSDLNALPPVAVSSLASRSCGFPVSCYGYVESSEEELQHGVLALRLPLRRHVVRALLLEEEEAKAENEDEEEEGVRAPTQHSRVCRGISLALSPSTRADTSFMEHYP